MAQHSPLLLLMQLQLQPLVSSEIRCSSQGKTHTAQRERERESRKKSSVSPSSGSNCLRKAVRIKPWGDMTLQEINECEANAFKRTHLSSASEKTSTHRKNQHKRAKRGSRFAAGEKTKCLQRCRTVNHQCSENISNLTFIPTFVCKAQ